MLAARAHAIGAALVPVVQPIYAAIQRAIRVLQALPALTRFEQQEAEEFAYYMKHINGGGAIAVRDTVVRAAQGLVTREAAAQLSAAVVRCEDRVARARARLEGHILTGHIDQYVCTHRGRNSYHIAFDLVSSQASPHVRVGDTLYWADHLLRHRALGLPIATVPTCPALTCCARQSGVWRLGVPVSRWLVPDTVCLIQPAFYSQPCTGSCPSSPSAPRAGAPSRPRAGPGAPGSSKPFASVTDRLALSALARRQSLWSAAPKRSKTAWCRRSHTRAFCHARRRRQHVTPLPQPISWGTIAQGMPLLSTKRMPVKAA